MRDCKVFIYIRDKRFRSQQAVVWWVAAGTRAANQRDLHLTESHRDYHFNEAPSQTHVQPEEIDFYTFNTTNMIFTIKHCEEVCRYSSWLHFSLSSLHFQTLVWSEHTDGSRMQRCRCGSPRVRTSGRRPKSHITVTDADEPSGAK